MINKRRWLAAVGVTALALLAPSIGSQAQEERLRSSNIQSTSRIHGHQQIRLIVKLACKNKLLLVTARKRANLDAGIDCSHIECANQRQHHLFKPFPGYETVASSRATKGEILA